MTANLETKNNEQAESSQEGNTSEKLSIDEFKKTKENLCEARNRVNELVLEVSNLKSKSDGLCLFLILSPFVMLLIILVGFSINDYRNQNRNEILKSFDWVKFKYDALDKLANISLYDINEVETLNEIGTLDKTSFDATYGVSIGSWQVYQFLIEETKHIPQEYNQAVFRKFKKIAAIDRERRLQSFEKRFKEFIQMFNEFIGVCM